MRNEIQNAIEIADAYRNQHEGEIPVLVIAHGKNELNDEVQNVYVGVFRDHKNHTHEDQKMFCSVMRMGFAMNNVDRYEILVKPQFNYAQDNMTLNALAVVAVNETEKVVQWFEIEDDGLTPHFSDEPMPVEGMFTQLLPTQAEREYEYNDKTVKGIDTYLQACSYEVPKEVVETFTAEEEVVDDALEAMVKAFS
jgi:hypothetical protein